MARKRGKAPTGKSRRSDGPVFARHPLAGIDTNLLKAAFAKVGRRRVEEFPQILSRFELLFQRVHPLSIVSMIAGWGMLSGVGDSGTSGETLLSGISQHHIELLQALALRQPPDSWGSNPATPHDIQQAIDDIRELADAFHERRFLHLEDERSEQERTVLGLQERLRGNTQIVRNWGYQGDVRKISRELFSPLDPLMRQRHNFGASDVMAVAEALEAVVADRLNTRFMTLKHIFRQKSIRQLVRIYYRDYPGVEGDPEAFLANIPSGTSYENVRSKLLAHADLALLGFLTIRSEDIAAQIGIHEETVRLILERFSHPPGALAENDPEFLFLANPVWLRPGIGLGADYFFPMPWVIFSFIFPIMRDLCDTKSLRQALEKRRASYLEDRMEVAVRAAFPTSTIRSKLKWSWQGRQYETDLLVLFDRTLLIFEAKSAALRVRLENHGWAFRRSMLPPMATRIMALETSIRFS